MYFVSEPLGPVEVTGKGFTVRLKRPKKEQNIKYVDIINYGSIVNK